MLKFLKKVFPNQTNGYRLYRDFVQNNESYLHQTGWLASLTLNKPVDRNGDPVPWMNYPVVNLLTERLPSGSVMFEYGSGNSTGYWAKRISEVHSVEYDKAWYDIVRAASPQNASIYFCAQDRDGLYCRSVLHTEKQFDIVVVDGRDRVNCVRHAIQALRPRGVIVLDDSDRENYLEAFSIARNADFLALSLRGLKPTGSEAHQSTIFYRQDNCLGL